MRPLFPSLFALCALLCACAQAPLPTDGPASVVTATVGEGRADRSAAAGSRDFDFSR